MHIQLQWSLKLDVQKKETEKRCSNSDKLKVSEIAYNSPVVSVRSACISPFLFSDGSPSTIDIVHTSTHSIAHGDADADTIQMEMYDLYQEEDGELHTPEYLHKCNAKVKEDKIY